MQSPEHREEYPHAFSMLVVGLMLGASQLERIFAEKDLGCRMIAATQGDKHCNFT